MEKKSIPLQTEALLKIKPKRISDDEKNQYDTYYEFICFGSDDFHRVW